MPDLDSLTVLCDDTLQRQQRVPDIRLKTPTTDEGIRVWLEAALHAGIKLHQTSTAQHSTAQHSTAQRSTAQHSTL